MTSATPGGSGVPDGLLYTADHEWLRADGDEATVGITAYAQDQLGEIVHLVLPDAGATLTAGEPFGEIESIKTVSDLFAPVSGELVATNPELADHPELVNGSPYGDGWLLRVRLADTADLEGLLSAEDYRRQLPEA